MKLNLTKEQCLRMARNEGDADIGAGAPMQTVFVCSNRNCFAVWDADPRGHCPACRQPSGLGWSTITCSVRHLERDNCEICGGLRGGVPGNENHVNDAVMCDYCHADHLTKTRGATA